MQNRSGEKINLKDGHITLGELVGGGQFGAVYKAKYVGSDPAILALGDEIAVKVGKIQEDQAVAASMQEWIKCNPGKEKEFYQKINAGYFPEGAELVMVAPYAENGDLSQFVPKAVSNKDPRFDPNNGDHLSVTLAQLAVSMQRAMTFLHDAGFYHFDIAARNFLVPKPRVGADGAITYSAVLTDLGMNQLIPKDGVTPIPATGPIKWRDQKALNENVGSIITDLYAFRSTLLEMMAFAAGYNTNDVLNLGSKDKPQKIMEYCLNRRDDYPDDSSALTALIGRIRDPNGPLPNMCANLQIKKFLDAFEKYLTQMPKFSPEELQSPEGIRKIRERDQRMFQDALIKFNYDIRKELEVRPNPVIEARLPRLTRPEAKNAAAASSSAARVSSSALVAQQLDPQNPKAALSRQPAQAKEDKPEAAAKRRFTPPPLTRQPAQAKDDKPEAAAKRRFTPPPLTRQPAQAKVDKPEAATEPARSRPPLTRQPAKAKIDKPGSAGRTLSAPPARKSHKM